MSDDFEARLDSMIQIFHHEYGEGDLGNLEDPIEELVYISLTRQTHQQNARRSWEAIMDAGGVHQLVDMDEGELAILLKPSGFSNQKAKWIKASLCLIREQMGELSLADAEQWSDKELEVFLRSLPGVSIKSAKCIMLYSMDRRVLPVDTHLRRFATRFGLVPEGQSEKEIHEELERVVPAKDRYSLHVNAIWHGRQVCTAPNPSCSECPVSRLCDFWNSHQAASVGAA